MPTVVAGPAARAGPRLLAALRDHYGLDDGAEGRCWRLRTALGMLADLGAWRDAFA
jgi:hypothetical protein